jgi:hypothetical protein
VETTTIDIGDTVRVMPYTCTTMNGDVVKGFSSNRLAIVTGISKDYAWRSAPNQVDVRILEPGESHAYTDSFKTEKVQLVEKGNGTFVLGQTHPFSPYELERQRWDELVAKAKAAPLEHEGFVNAATFLAWLYLNQEPRAHTNLPGMRRKDGSINPNKVEKLFSTMGLTIDSWAFECPVAIPAEFKNQGNPVAYEQRIDWREVAEQFADATTATP